MITRAMVDHAIGPGGTPAERLRRGLAVVLKVSKAEIDRRAARAGLPSTSAERYTTHRRKI